jgi:hypothetical protein
MYQEVRLSNYGKICRVSSNLVDETGLASDGPRAAEYAEQAGLLVVRLVSTLEKTDAVAMRKSSRGKAEICLARQMAMYLMHTVFSCSYHHVATFFKRDRTTISHACKLVEDLRDNEEFDKRLEAMENLLVSARCLSEVANRGA